MSLREEFKEKIQKKVASDLGLKNLYAVPCLQKIVINVGVGEAARDQTLIPEISRQLIRITGQKAEIRKAKRAISGFKVRKGLEVGLRVTLRGKKMYDFFEKLVDIVFPRIRDFRGVKEQNFDQNGNLNLGIREVIIFPEISFDDLKKNFGFSISIVTTAKKQEQAIVLLQNLGMVFSKG